MPHHSIYMWEGCARTQHTDSQCLYCVGLIIDEQGVDIEKTDAERLRLNGVFASCHLSNVSSFCVVKREDPNMQACSTIVIDRRGKSE